MSARFWLPALNRALGAPPLRWLIRPPALGNRGSNAQFADWDFSTAAESLRWYAPHDAIAGRRILDLGCGHGGKACYYAAAGAANVVGVDVSSVKIEQAREAAARRGIGTVHFVVGDARALPVRHAAFDMVMLNDSFEHVAEPETVLREAHRVLRSGGTAHIAFPPFRSPWGGHLAAHIRIPWAHLLFPESELVAFWKSADAADRRGLAVYPPGWDQVGTDGAGGTLEDILPLNRMTLRRCAEIVEATSFKIRIWRNKTPGNLGGLLAHAASVSEYVVTRAMIVLQK